MNIACAKLSASKLKSAGSVFHQVAAAVVAALQRDEALTLVVCPANKCAKFLYCVKEIMRRRGLANTKPHQLLTASRKSPMERCMSETCCF
jgi:hypothetical protein